MSTVVTVAARTGRLVVIAALLLPAGCGGDSTAPTPAAGVVKVSVSPSTSVVPVTGTLQISASVTRDGAATSEPITWTTSAAAVATVSGSGLVTGVAVGSATITAGIPSGVTASATIDVTAAVLIPASVTKTAGDDQRAPVGSLLSGAASVTVRDASGGLVAGAPVTFAVASGGGSVTGATTVTNMAGIATVGGWTLGPSGATHTMTATVGSLPAVTFTATGFVPTPAAVSFATHSSTLQTAGTLQIVATVTKDGAVISDPLSWTTSNGSAATVSAAGVVTAVAPGSTTITATIATGASASSGITIVAGPAASTVKTAGDNQTAPFGAELPIAAAVTVKDVTDAPVAGAAVTFAIVSGGGSLTGATATTNTSGVAAVGGWRLGSTAANTMTAKVGTLAAVTFSATGVAPAPASVSFAAHQAIVAIGSSVATTATVRDASGATMSGSPVTYVSRTPAVATVSSTGQITGAGTGRATIVVTSNSTIQDSLLAVVIPPGGQALVSSLDGFNLAVGATFTVSIYMDMSASTKRLSSGQVDVKFSTSQMVYQSHAAGSGVAAAVNTGDASTGTIRLAFADPAGLTGRVELLRITFKASATAGATGSLQLTATELTATDFTDLMGSTVRISQPLIVR